MSDDNIPDYDSMSDEEFAQQTPPEVAFDDEGKDVSGDHISASGDPDKDDFGLGELDTDDDKDLGAEDQGEEDDPEDDDGQEDTSDQDDEDEDPESEEDADKEKDPSDDPDEDKDEEDKELTPEEKAAEKNKEEDSDFYKGEMDKLLSPFRANNGEMAVKNVDEARTLMAQGANYTKKMQQIKPNLKIIKKLGNNELLDEGKLDLLIEAAKGKPEAISKLLAEHSIDPFSLSTDNADSYKPESHAVSDAEIELDQVLDELQGSESITRTLQEVNQKWDTESRQIVASKPENLRIIHDHIESGLYDVIQGEVNRRMALWQVRGTNSLLAYQQVGEELKNSGQLDKFFKQEPPAPKKTPSKPSGKQDDAKTRDKRKRAASKAPSRSGKNGKSKPAKKEIWEMSDAEFEEAMSSGNL